MLVMNRIRGFLKIKKRKIKRQKAVCDYEIWESKKRNSIFYFSFEIRCWKIFPLHKVNIKLVEKCNSLCVFEENNERAFIHGIRGVLYEVSNSDWFLVFLYMQISNPWSELRSKITARTSSSGKHIEKHWKQLCRRDGIARLFLLSTP